MPLSGNPPPPDDTRFFSICPHPVVLDKTFLLAVVLVVILLELSFTLGVFWLLIFSLVPAALLMWDIVARACREYLIARHGVFHPVSSGVPFTEITNVSSIQRLSGNLLGFGRIVVGTQSERGAIEFE